VRLASLAYWHHLNDNEEDCGTYLIVVFLRSSNLACEIHAIVRRLLWKLVIWCPGSDPGADAGAKEVRKRLSTKRHLRAGSA
jgi:hypothetical protein